MASGYTPKSEILDIFDILITRNFVYMPLLYFIFELFIIENFKYTQRQNNTMNLMYLSPVPTSINNWPVMPQSHSQLLSPPPHYLEANLRHPVISSIHPLVYIFRILM